MVIALSLQSCSGLTVTRTRIFDVQFKSKQMEILNGEKPKVKNEELKTVTQIEETPFAVVKYNDDYFVAFGRWRISENYENFEAAKERAKDLSWDTLLQVIYAVATEVYEENRPNDVVPTTKKGGKK